MLNEASFEKMNEAEAAQVKALREIIKAAGIPAKTVDKNLLIATFNIREFGAKPRRGFAINALAEICNNFHVIAIQEVRSQLGDLRRMLQVLGPYWKVLFNDPAGAPKNKGNDERFAFVYDSRVVRFTGMAAELLITDDFLSPTGLPKSDMSVPWRTPFTASFRAGHFDFVLLTVHIQWNENGGIEARAKEIEMITGWLEKQRQAAKLYDPDLLVLGDFNIPGLKSPAFEALVGHGLAVPGPIRQISTDLGKIHHYDQIAFYPGNAKCKVGKAGALDFSGAFFPKSMTKKEHEDMTYQISDHLPLWVEMEIKELSLDQFISQ